jgi:Fe-S-cluster containining protein
MNQPLLSRIGVIVSLMGSLIAAANSKYGAKKEMEPKQIGRAMTSPREVAIKLLQATSLSDESVFLNQTIPTNTLVDYYRIACNILFVCERCGTCCITGNPIRLSQKDISRIARYIKIPLNKAIKRLTIPDPAKPGVVNFKKINPCKFYDPVQKGCKIYDARPWSCRIFPFIGIYGSEDQIKIHESCPGSVKAVKALTDTVEELRSDPNFPLSFDLDTVKDAKQYFKDVLSAIR